MIWSSLPLRRPSCSRGMDSIPKDDQHGINGINESKKTYGHNPKRHTPLTTTPHLTIPVSLTTKPTVTGPERVEPEQRNLVEHRRRTHLQIKDKIMLSQVRFKQNGPNTKSQLIITFFTGCTTECHRCQPAADLNSTLPVDPASPQQPGHHRAKQPHLVQH